MAIDAILNNSAIREREERIRGGKVLETSKEMAPLKVLELFAGRRCIGRAFEARGHDVFSVDYDKVHTDIDLYADIEHLTAADILRDFGQPDIIWASPDCTTYSIAALWRHRNKVDGVFHPKSDYAVKSDRVNRNLMNLIRVLNPKYYFIENPRGAMRHMDWMTDLPRYTVTYCQYGDTRMKPTDIWTNHENPNFKPMCKNGDPCHEPAPRGSNGGTQGKRSKIERSLIPHELCDYIVDLAESGKKVKP